MTRRDKNPATSLLTRRGFGQAMLLTPLSAALVGPGMANVAWAQAGYPSRPVRFILPFAAGGVADVTARIVAEKLGEKLGQRVVVENMGGAGGIAAARAALQAGNDGHTVTLLTNGTAISVPLFKSLPFDPFKDFAPVSTIGLFDCIFVTNAASEYRTLADFVKAAKEKPGTLNVGTIVVGSTQNLSAELFKSTAGINFQIVPFRTSPEAVVGLLRNDIQVVVDFPAALKAGLQDGKLRTLATTGPKRSASMPNIPTAQEAGVANYEVTSWNAMYVPAGTPAAIIDILNRGLREILADADVKKRMLELGIEAHASSPAEATARMKADIEKWSKVIADANIPKQ
jgi:tripartite-type tricarboxylate transporter receptor subunit TctC